MEPVAQAWEQMSWSNAHAKEMSGKQRGQEEIGTELESHDSSPMSYRGFV